MNAHLSINYILLLLILSRISNFLSIFAAANLGLAVSDHYTMESIKKIYKI